MAFKDFPNGLKDLNDYLSANRQVSAQLSGSTADISRLVVSAEFDYNLKEMICSLLAGRGLKLPNIQICISLNLKELLKLPNIQAGLYAALDKLNMALDKFLENTKLDKVLGRINKVLAEITNIANMINFCSTPIDPVSIPNLLESSMQSFLGKGKSLIDRIGTLVPDQIGGCLVNGQFNCNAFNGGILGSICNNYSAVQAGTASQSFINSITSEINSVASEIDTLIESENKIIGAYDQGGSDLAETTRPVNTNMGVLYNASDEGIQGATRAAGALQAAYNNLGSYQVVADDGTVYNNIFETFVDDDLLRILRRTPDPSPEISEQQPVYNYCGEIIGYTNVISQETETTSVGSAPVDINQPGYNAAGLTTNPVTEASAPVDNVIPSGATWQDVTSLRTAGVSEQNSTGAPVEVSIRAVSTDGTLPLFEVSEDGSNWLTLATFTTSMTLEQNITGVRIPNNYYYRVSTNTSILSWIELR